MTRVTHRLALVTLLLTLAFLFFFLRLLLALDSFALLLRASIKLHT